jgi:hypothetical protein
MISLRQRQRLPVIGKQVNAMVSFSLKTRVKPDGTVQVAAPRDSLRPRLMFSWSFDLKLRAMKRISHLNHGPAASLKGRSDVSPPSL